MYLIQLLIRLGRMAEAIRSGRGIGRTCGTYVSGIGVTFWASGITDTPRSENLSTRIRAVQCKVKVGRLPAAYIRDVPDNLVVRLVVTPSLINIRYVTVRRNEKARIPLIRCVYIPYIHNLERIVVRHVWLYRTWLWPRIFRSLVDN